MTTLYEEVYKLKKLLRRGWLLRNVNGRTESDAEHCYSMMMLALELMNKNNLQLDQLKVVKMIAYHDLGEIDVGDYTPVDDVTAEEKHKKEHVAIKRIAEAYNMPEIEELWLEFEENKTAEAQFVKHVDKYDAILQSKIYAEENNNPALFEEFKQNAIKIYEDMIKLKR